MQYPSDIWQLVPGVHIDDAKKFAAAVRAVADDLDPREIGIVHELEVSQSDQGLLLRGMAVALEEATEEVAHRLYCDVLLERFRPDSSVTVQRTINHLDMSRIVVEQLPLAGRERLVLDITKGWRDDGRALHLLGFPYNWWWEVCHRVQMLFCAAALAPDLILPVSSRP